ncbi:MAG TPA: alpha/beta hydrolase [Polyangiaceae bacterium]|nr:alpha/beta hydrolase [Polyangiaceae bacterium]
MLDSPPSTAVFVHHSVDAEGLSIHVAEFREARRADPDRPGILFLHGWPENWSCFQGLMPRLSREFNVAAIDLPGIGESSTAPPSGDKLTLARYVRAVLRELGWKNASLVGHDVGGQIVFSYLKSYPGELSSAMLLNVAVPGVDPWSEIERNPHLWHFAFHAVAELPERLIAGREAEYFSFFYDAVAAQPGAVPAFARQRYAEAYRRPDSLRTSFEWYRSFAQDQIDNARVKQQHVPTPVLYLRGDAERGIELERYLAGLRAHGLSQVYGDQLAGSGHFTPDEQPELLASRIETFVRDHALSAKDAVPLGRP